MSLDLFCYRKIHWGFGCLKIKNSDSCYSKWEQFAFYFSRYCVNYLFQPIGGKKHGVYREIFAKTDFLQDHHFTK